MGNTSYEKVKFGVSDCLYFGPRKNINPLRAGKYFSLKTNIDQGTGDFVASRVYLFDESILVYFVLRGQSRMCEIPILILSQRIHMLFVFFFLFIST